MSSDDTHPFWPPVALASLSGRSDATWARQAGEYVGVAFLGGVALDEQTRRAARQMAARGREEFLPAAPLAFVEAQLSALSESAVRPGINVRTTTPETLRDVGEVCQRHDAIVEINAHCRQDEMRAVGGGEALLEDGDRLREQVAVAAETGATVSVKVRTEVAGVDLPALAARLDEAGASILHVDAMDSERVVGAIADRTDARVIANNGVRDTQTVHEYLEYGADAVSVARPSDDPATLERVRDATIAFFDRATTKRYDEHEGSE